MIHNILSAVILTLIVVTLAFPKSTGRYLGVVFKEAGLGEKEEQEAVRYCRHRVIVPTIDAHVGCVERNNQ